MTGHIQLGDDEIKHLEMIQAVVARTAQNSFNLKTWAVTLLVGVFALSARDADYRFLLLAVVPAAGFWALDAYFLVVERRYRALYDDVRRQAGIESFSMDTSISASVETFPRALRSAPLLGFYGTLAALLAGLGWVLF